MLHIWFGGKQILRQGSAVGMNTCAGLKAAGLTGRRETLNGEVFTAKASLSFRELWGWRWKGALSVLLSWKRAWSEARLFSLASGPGHLGKAGDIFGSYNWGGDASGF